MNLEKGWTFLTREESKNKSGWLRGTADAPNMSPKAIWQGGLEMREAGRSTQQGALVIFEVLCSSEHLKLSVWLCL